MPTKPVLILSLLGFVWRVGSLCSANPIWAWDGSLAARNGQ